ncbi:MAG: hypothetical protein ACYDEE_00055 [Ignavibacteriaceae bacterium]
MPKKQPDQITVISTTEGRRNPILKAVTDSPIPQTPGASVPSLTDAPELSPSNSPVISKDPPKADSTEKSPNKTKHFRVTDSDVFYKGKSYPEGSIVDFQDDHLNKYLVPIIEEDITPEDKVYDTSTIAPVSMDTSLDPKYVASRRRGRPRQL